jgi:transcriptional regulator with XRE-family HTH domain
MAMAAVDDRNVRTFGEAIHVLRIKAGMSCHQVGHAVGVDRDLVKEWERESATPSPLHLKKLYEALPKLKYFTTFLPRMMRDQITSRAYAAGSNGHTLWVPPSPTPADLPVPEDLVRLSFGDALLSAIQDEGMVSGDLGELVGATPDIIHNWTVNIGSPTDSQYLTLLELFPDLKDAPLPGHFAYTAPPVFERPLAPIIPIQPEYQLPPPLPQPAPPPPPAPVVRKTAPRSKVDQAGIAHANALVAVHHARLHLESLRNQMTIMEAEVASLEGDVEESKKALMEAVHRAAEEKPY